MCWLDRMFRSVIVFVVAVLFVTALPHRATAQACTPEAALAVRSEWQENPANLVFADDVATKQSQAAILERLEGVAAMFREAYPEPQGTAAEGYALIRRQGDEIEEGPVPWGYTSLYKTWMCVKSTGEIELAGETGNWARLYVNGLHSLLDEVGEMTVDGERSMVWMLARRIGDLRGETLYEAWGGLKYGRALLFTRPGEFPWKPVSQKQYLDALVIYYRETVGGAAERVDALQRAMEEQLEETKRTMTGEARDQLVAELERSLADLKASRAAGEERAAPAHAEELAYIENYLATHSEQEMQQPAFLDRGLKLTFSGEFTDEADGGHMLVRVDPGYFHEDLSPEAAQLLLLMWEWESESEASDRWHETFESNFPIDRLRAMLGS